MMGRAVRWRTVSLALMVFIAGSSLRLAAAAQGTTAAIHGTIADDTGPLPGATITAKDTQTGFTYQAVSDRDGSFNLSGLRPATYDISVEMDQYKPQAKTVQVLVGQMVTANFKIDPDVIYTESVEVVGSSRLVETRTAQVATNVTTDQIRYLPQNQRNFLNFAALAPGARVSDAETRKQVTAGGLDATQINVFIDGVSYKNDVLDGGVVGQDSSRGSPFPQTAVQEFQVLTQNYRAEHEKASSLVITAVTKSGGNQWSGEGFLFYQDKNLVGDEYLRPEARRSQAHVQAVSTGPVGRRANRQGPPAGVRVVPRQTVRIGPTASFVGSTPFPASLNFLRAYEGQFISPFREKLFFGKLTAQPESQPDPGCQLQHPPGDRHSQLRRTGQLRLRRKRAEQVDSVLGRYMVPGSRWLNEMTVTWQRSNWNPEPENISDVGLDYQRVMRIGGRDTTQDFIQTRASVRDDYSRYLTWNGSHTVKAGAVFSVLRYDVTKLFNGNPVFRFRQDEAFAFPFEAAYGVGNPDLSTNNRQLGFYVQDDWNASPRVTLNAGVRWDYESDMLNNDYVTPAAVRAATAPFVDGGRYFTDGTDRPPFYGAWQPRARRRLRPEGRAESMCCSADTDAITTG